MTDTKFSTTLLSVFAKVPFIAGCATLITIFAWFLLPSSYLRESGMFFFIIIILLFLLYSFLLWIFFSALAYKKSGGKALLGALLAGVFLLIIGGLFLSGNRFLYSQSVRQMKQKQEAVHNSLHLDRLRTKIGPPLSALNDAYFYPEFGNAVLDVALYFDIDVREAGVYIFEIRTAPDNKIPMRVHWQESLGTGHRTVEKTIAVTDIDPLRPYNYVWLGEGQTDMRLGIFRSTYKNRVLDQAVSVPALLVERTSMPAKPFFPPVQPRTESDPP